MTTLYITDCTPLCDQSIIEQLLPRLDSVRQKKVRSLKVLEKQAQSAAAGLLLLDLFGVDASYIYTELGKPQLTDHRAHFSIAHSGQWVGVAVSDANIGVDIQTVSPIRPAVLRRAFSQDEQVYIGEDAVRFTKLWTRKEAYAKYTGEGVARQLSAAIPEIPFCTGCHADFVYTICGDDTVRIVIKNAKDLL